MSGVEVFVDLRPRFGHARDQGPRPTCLAFAASDTHAGVRPGWLPLSSEYAFHRAQMRTGSGPDEGATLASMLDVLREDGQPEEHGWPYLPATPVDAASWVPPGDVGPLFRCGSERRPVGFDFIVGEIERGQPVIVLIRLSRSFFRPNADGVIHPATGEMPEMLRRHAVVAVGHGKAGGHRAILVRNSWGAKWGERGHAWLTEAFLGPRIYAAAKLTEDVVVSPDSPAA